MVTGPPLIAVTNPVTGSTVATEVLLLVHVPPGGMPAAVKNILVSPWHILLPTTPEPLAQLYTYTSVVVLQPVGNVYVMVATPADTPVTTPVTGSIDATDTGDELHVPPAGEPGNGILVPTHICELGMAAGRGLTVTVAELLQPVTASVKYMVASPGDTAKNNLDVAGVHPT